MNELAQAIFGDPLSPIPLTLPQVAARAVWIYLIGIFIVRLGKSRLVSRNTSLDVILGFILGSLLSRGITGKSSITDTTAATVALVAAHWVMTWAACRSHKFGELFKGRTKQLVVNGELQPAAMWHSNVSVHDVEEAMRLNGYESLSEVRNAYKERNGEISIIPAKKSGNGVLTIPYMPR